MAHLWCFFFFSSRRRHTRFDCDWSSDVCSSDLCVVQLEVRLRLQRDEEGEREVAVRGLHEGEHRVPVVQLALQRHDRSEERRVGKECRTRWSSQHIKKKLQMHAAPGG